MEVVGAPLGGFEEGRGVGDYEAGGGRSGGVQAVGGVFAVFVENRGVGDCV